MFIIFGWPKRTLDEKKVEAYCQRCQRKTIHTAAVQQTWFSLFFIPVVPIGTKQPQTACSVCGQDLTGPVVAAGAGAIRAGIGGGGRPTKRCPACAEDIMTDARVCHYCHHEFSEEDVILEQRRIAEAEAVREATAAAEQQRKREKWAHRRARFVRGIGSIFVTVAVVFLFGIIGTLVSGNSGDGAVVGAVGSFLIVVVIPGLLARYCFVKARKIMEAARR